MERIDRFFFLSPDRAFVGCVLKNEPVFMKWNEKKQIKSMIDLSEYFFSLHFSSYNTMN